MGLISEEVEVVLNPNNVKYYENLNYEIPRHINKSGKLITSMGTKILIKTEHLLAKSSAKVDIKCDNCDKELKDIIWRDYSSQITKDNIYYCHKCASNLYGAESARLARLKNGKSFEQWCIENNRQDILDRWDYELNDCKPNEISYSNAKKYYFKCPIKIHGSELKKINDFVNGSEGSIDCKACKSFAQWGINNLCEDFLDKYWDYDKNTVDPWEISWASSTKQIWIKCQEKDYHESYNTICNSFSNGHRCGYCNSNGGKVHPLDSLGKYLEDKGLLYLWSDKNKKSPYKYTPSSNKKVYWKCIEKIHEDFPRSIRASNNYGFRCPECKYSKGEEKISNYLINDNFTKIIQEDYNVLDIIFKNKYKYYIPQKKFDGLIGLGNGLLSYDFYLPNYNFLIEYDGEYHYKAILKYKNEPIKYAEERLKQQQEHDRLKNEYAKNNNIKLLRIPYWEIDNIEKILDNFLV